MDAEKLFELRCALMLAEVREECEPDGKEPLFEHFKNTLGGALPDLSYAQIGSELGMSEAAVKMSPTAFTATTGGCLRTRFASRSIRPMTWRVRFAHLFGALNP